MASLAMRLTLNTIAVALLLFCGQISRASSSSGPAHLRCDGLDRPLGIDSSAPSFSWQLHDASNGARQTAYQIRVYRRTFDSVGAVSEVWNSGKILSALSSGIRYMGPSLQPSTRYFWRVRVWGRDGKVYRDSETNWWETGLMNQADWHAQWIGLENEQLHSIRESGARWITNRSDVPSSSSDTHHDFRFHFRLDKPIRQAVLYATGEEAVAAWVNGESVMRAEAAAPGYSLAWGTYKTVEVKTSLRQGENVLAIEIIRYKGTGKTVSTQTPMNASLYLRFEDGGTLVLKTEDSGWKASLDRSEAWWSPQFDDRSWPNAILYDPAKDVSGPTDTSPPWPTGPVVALRHDFLENKKIISARLYATALGAYELHLNGRRVGDEVLAPGWTDYREQVLYQTYDVTANIRQGKNTIAAYLAPGWYSTPLTWFQQGNNYGNTQPALLAQLRMEYSDGSVKWICSDGNWIAAASSISEAELYNGQTRDSRRELVGWDLPGAKTRSWTAATIVQPHSPRIIAQYFEPIRIKRAMRAKAITSPKPGVYIFDFGQNMTAIPRLLVHGRAGDVVQLRFGEILNPDGSLYVANLRTAKATDRFVLSGKNSELYQPQFTFHGFRYAEITGIRQRPSREVLSALVIHTDARLTSTLTTGSRMVNQLWRNVLWGQKSNFVGLPTDCPQRDERLGWSADAQVFWRTATYNMDLSSFSRKYAADLRTTQAGTPMYGIYAPGTATKNPGYGAAWSDAGVIVPWTSWIQSGDAKVINENWEAMVQYLEAIESRNPDHLWRRDFGYAFGDWLTPTITTPEDLISTAYWAYDATLMREMALATGRESEAAHYADLFEQIKTAFQKAYVRPDGVVGAVNKYPSIPPPTVHAVAGSDDHDAFIETQTGYVLALHMKLLPDQLRTAAADRLVRLIGENHWRLGTGFLGTPYLLEELSDSGHVNVAYRLLFNTDYPSWGYLIEHGGTTTWERWNGDTKRDDASMNSYNHYAYGAVAEWIYRYAAGVDTTPESPGFATVLLHPNFDRRLEKLRFSYESSKGVIVSQWKVVGTLVRWTVTIPANASAVVAKDRINAELLTINGISIGESQKLSSEGLGKYRLGPGTYRFTGRLKL